MSTSGSRSDGAQNRTGAAPRPTLPDIAFPSTGPGSATASGVPIDRRGAFAALAGSLAAAGAAACRASDPARAAAEQFIDAYYVEIDLPRARDRAVGLARSKVEEQIRLVAGQQAPDASARPTVHYRFVDAQGAGEGGDRRGFVYELAVRIDGGEEITRRVLVTVRDDGGAWHAANFQEMD